MLMALMVLLENGAVGAVEGVCIAVCGVCMCVRVCAYVCVWGEAVLVTWRELRPLGAHG